MYSPQLEKMLEELIAAAENISMGRYSDQSSLYAMTDSTHYPPVITRFAEAFGMMAVKVEAREFRLEQMIDDLTTARDELTIANEKLQQSLLDLQQAQMQLIQQAKMETVGRLAAGVAHEVKNPLAIIQLGTDFLASELKDNRVWHETVMDMEDAVQRADHVIKGLLDFSRSEQLDLHETDLQHLVDDSLLLVRHELNSNHITVEQERNEALPLLMLDRNKLKQVFINLFMNAVHAMPDGGALSISAAIHVVTPADLMTRSSSQARPAVGDRAVLLKIADTGTGIKEETVTKLFDPFFTTKPVGVGTGLGLSVTRKILELHQALITLKNRNDRQGAEAVLLFTL
jgi:signal transduction histidine kinase